MKTLTTTLLFFLFSVSFSSSALLADLGYFVSSQKSSSKKAGKKSISTGLFLERSDGQIRFSAQVEEIIDKMTEKKERSVGLAWGYNYFALGESRKSALITKIGAGCNFRIAGRDSYVHTSLAVCRGLLGSSILVGSSLKRSLEMGVEGHCDTKLNCYAGGRAAYLWK